VTQPEYDLYGIFTDQILDFERWTYEDARAAEKEWLKRKETNLPGSRHAGVSPLVQWHSWTRELPRLRKLFEPTGEFTIVFEAITECINSRLPIPLWCAVPLRSAWGKIDRFEQRSWDEVFGKPHQGKNLNYAQRRRKDMIPIVLDIIDRIDRGAKVQDTLEAVAKKSGVSTGTARGWYYAHRKKFPITETLMSDGWYYQKKTGEPDSKYRKHRPASE
jgi:hypothetical protein